MAAKSPGEKLTGNFVSDKSLLSSVKVGHSVPPVMQSEVHNPTLKRKDPEFNPASRRN